MQFHQEEEYKYILSKSISPYTTFLILTFNIFDSRLHKLHLLPKNLQHKAQKRSYLAGKFPGFLVLKNNLI